MSVQPSAATTEQPPLPSQSSENLESQNRRAASKRRSRTKNEDDGAHEGVLWKRRDIFRNRWRPRWFVLQPGQAVLTYYLLSSTSNATEDQEAMRSRLFSSTTSLANMSGSPAQRSTATTGGSSSSSNTRSARVRSTSVDSTVSENSMDYDVVPRGTIFLLGCSVAADDAHSRPHESLYAFTISPPNPQSEQACYLATKSPEARDIWVAKLQAVCHKSQRPATPLRLQSLREERSSRQDNDDGLAADPPAEPWESASTTSNSAQEFNQERDPTMPSSSSPRDTSAKSPTTAHVAIWKTLQEGQATMMDNIPEQLAQRIEQVLDRHLPWCRVQDEEHGWSLFLDRRDQGGLIAESRPYDAVHHAHVKGSTLIRSQAVLDHSVWEIFALLMDPQRRSKLETNLRYHERLDSVNAQTTLDYLAYHPVWPTFARDFGVVGHWRVLTRDPNDHQPKSEDDSATRAIVLFGFSSQEAEAYKAPAPHHVRGTLLISLYFLEDLGAKCRVTRLLSYDLGGSLPRQLNNAVLQQQATMPLVIAQILDREDEQQSDPRRLRRLRGTLLTNEILIEKIINKRFNEDNDNDLGSLREHEGTEEDYSLGSPVADSNGNLVKESFLPRGDSAYGPRIGARRFSFLEEALLLLGPVVLYHVVDKCWGTIDHDKSDTLISVVFVWKELLFVATAFWAVNTVILTPNAANEMHKPASTSPIRCRFLVDLKGVLRYLAQKTQEREDAEFPDLGEPDAPTANDIPELSVVHIAVRAVQIAMKGKEGQHVLYGAASPIDVSNKQSAVISILQEGHPPISLSADQGGDIEAVAKRMRAATKAAESPQGECWEPAPGFGVVEFIRNLFLKLGFVRLRPVYETAEGRCVIYSAPDSDGCQIDIDVVPPDGTQVAVVIGGVRVLRRIISATDTMDADGVGGGDDQPEPTPKPYLAMSVAFNSAFCNVMTARRFVERIHGLLDNPELCDEPNSQGNKSADNY